MSHTPMSHTPLNRTNIRLEHSPLEEPVCVECDPVILVELGVRENGGKPFVFEHRSRSGCVRTAQAEADSLARSHGYEPWVVLGVCSLAS